MSTRLTPNQYAALIAVSNLGQPWAPIPDVAQLVGCPKEGVGVTLASLRRHGLVERTKIAGRVAYRLTDAGRRSVLDGRR